MISERLKNAVETNEPLETLPVDLLIEIIDIAILGAGRAVERLKRLDEPEAVRGAEYTLNAFRECQRRLSPAPSSDA